VSPVGFIEGADLLKRYRSLFGQPFEVLYHLPHVPSRTTGEKVERRLAVRKPFFFADVPE